MSAQCTADDKLRVGWLVQSPEGLVQLEMQGTNFTIWVNVGSKKIKTH